MKLDPRIIENKKPFTCFDTEKAKQFIGKDCYFSNSESDFQHLNIFRNSPSIDWYRYCKSKLIAVSEETNSDIYCFVAPPISDDGHNSFFKFCLPEEWVQEKEPEPEWRPYDLDAWRNDGYDIGCVLTFRYAAVPHDNVPIYTVVFHGTRECSADLNKSAILLGSEWYDFQKLFNEYEIFDNKYSDDDLCRWRPFGYQE